MQIIAWPSLPDRRTRVQLAAGAVLFILAGLVALVLIATTDISVFLAVAGALAVVLLALKPVVRIVSANDEQARRTPSPPGSTSAS